MQTYVCRWAESHTMNDRSTYVRLCWTEVPEKQQHFIVGTITLGREDQAFVKGYLEWLWCMLHLSKDLECLLRETFYISCISL